MEMYHLIESLYLYNLSLQEMDTMDTSNPAVFVNAELLSKFVGRKVRAVVQVLRIEGGSIIGTSSDDRQLTIKGPLPQQPLTTFVEVIGIAENGQSIRGEIFTNFGDNLDMFSYNRLGQLANAEHRSLFI
ncbi:hypothetical protein MKW94_017943 [Papaver nudicaule]|uniref:Uncharacterized protein n=1 Tax=Papaver nudicaule TaxID=74823 RepID=A0AA41S572_PAPNU|nr:hypothetical protein [Papaver nudicaule]